MEEYVKDIYDIINSEDKLVIVLVLAERCMEQETSFEVFLKEKYREVDIPMRSLRLCFDEKNIPFPRPITEAIYYFKPGNITPLLLRVGKEAVARFADDVNIVMKMMDGMSYTEALYDNEDDKKLIEDTEKLLSEDSLKYPKLSKMLKGFSKDMWESAKYAGKGLPILVSSDEASERFNICKECPFFTEEARCTKCGCFMKKKVNLAASSCPIDKW